MKKADALILKSYQLYHNYFHEHETLDSQTPAKAARIKVEGRNKWITVIQNASRDITN